MHRFAQDAPNFRQSRVLYEGSEPEFEWRHESAAPDSQLAFSVAGTRQTRRSIFASKSPQLNRVCVLPLMPGRCEHGMGAFCAAVLWSPPVPTAPVVPLTQSSVVAPSVTDAPTAPALSEREVAARLKRAAPMARFWQSPAFAVLMPLVLSFVLFWWLARK